MKQQIKKNVSYQTSREIITAKPIKFSVRESLPIDILPHQEIVNNQLKDIKKDYGMFFTPEWVVNFMVSLVDIAGLKNKKKFNILEPACGLCQFLIGIKRKQPELFKKSQLFGIELNPDIINYLTTLKIDKNINLIKTDYLLWNSKMTFDLIIGNPP
ncbi:MAG: N-6 DNA methylase, partial [Elusimicrobiota bacterium]